MKHILSLTLTAMLGLSATCFSQTAETNPNNIPIVSKAPVSYRVNVSGATLHGYYKKGYSLTIYGDSSAIGYRADCDEDDDWSGATAGGTTQTGNRFEGKYRCVFNPHSLFGTVLPGSTSAHNHFIGVNRLAASDGDLTITYKLDRSGNAVDSVIGVVFDRGPQNQPGESSVATCNKFGTNRDNNQFIYIIFPKSARYLKQVIGTKPDGKLLKRNPENKDFEQAYKLMMDQSNAGSLKSAKAALQSMLSSIPMVTNFDNATPEEKKQGKLKPANNDRNLNE